MTKRPGKFERSTDQVMAARLYAMTMDGCDEELGDVADFGWYGIIIEQDKGYIMAEDSQGFFDYDEYSAKEARRAWAKLEREYEKFVEREADNG